MADAMLTVETVMDTVVVRTTNCVVTITAVVLTTRRTLVTTLVTEGDCCWLSVPDMGRESSNRSKKKSITLNALQTQT